MAEMRRPPDRRSGPGHHTGAATEAEPPPGSIDQAIIAYVLAHSDECDLWRVYADAMWRDGYRAAWQAGAAHGRREAEDEMAAAWRSFAHPVAHPEAGAAQRIAAAIAGERRSAAGHERAFAARARNTPDYMRTDVQKAAVHLYPGQDAA
jgi:hypothetical protein